jgi:hypothetical protein
MRRLIIPTLLGGVLLVVSQVWAANWGPLKDDGCKSSGFRQFSAVLWNIPKGSNWEATCAESGHLDWGPPTRCVNQNGIKMWGEWDRPDATCK